MDGRSSLEGTGTDSKLLSIISPRQNDTSNDSSIDNTDNFAEEYRIKQQQMLGELQSIYKEKAEWKDKLKLAIDSAEDEPVIAAADQHNSSINELQLGGDDSMRDIPKEDIDLNYKDIGEQELLRNHNSVWPF